MFHGGDAQDKLVKQLKAQLAQKDIQISTLVNEQEKKNEILAETRRAKDEALYKAQTETARAAQADKLLQKTSTELQNANVRLSNLESTLNDAHDKHRRDGKEIERLQYEIDSRQNSSAGNSRLQSTITTLQDEIKSHVKQISKLESEKETLENEARLRAGGVFGSSGGGSGFGGSNGRDKSLIAELEGQVAGLRKENVRLMEESRRIATPIKATPSRPRHLQTFQASPSPRTKRSLSFSNIEAASRIQQLESEIDNLRSQSSSHMQIDLQEVEKLRTDLAAAKRQALKMENEKIALERSGKREVEEMQTKVADMEDELEYLRRFDSQAGNGSGALEKLKKESEKEKRVLESNLQAKSEELEKSLGDVKRLERKLDELEQEIRDREGTISDLSSQLQAAERAPISSSPDEALKARIFHLEAELTSKQNELAEAKSLAVKPTDLSASISSNSLAPPNPLAEKTLRALQRDIATLRRDKDALQADLAESEDLVAEKEAEIFKLRTQMPLPGDSRDNTMMVSPVSVDSSVEKYKLDELEATLKERSQDLEEERQRSRSLQAKVEEAERQYKEAEAQLQTLQEEHDELFISLDATRKNLGDKEEAIINLEAEIKRLEGDLGEFAAVQEKVDTLEAQVKALAVEKASIEVEMNQYKEQLESVRVELFGAEQMRDGMKARADELEAEIQRVKEQHQQETDAFDSEKQALLSRINTMTDESQRLKEQVDELENNIGDRSTESEARERDFQLEGLKEQVQALRTEIEAKSSELESVEQLLKQQESDRAVKEASLASELAKAQEATEEAADRALDAEGKCSALTEAVEKLGAEAEQLRSTEHQASAEVSRLRSQLDLASSRIDTLTQDLEDKDQLLEFADLEHKTIKEALSSAKTQVDNLSDAVMAAEEGKAATARVIEEGKAEADRLENDLGTLRMCYDDLVDEKQKIVALYQAASIDLDSKAREIANIQKQLQDTLSRGTADITANIVKEKAELEQRVVRRDLTIATEQARAQKLQVNLEMAQESIGEMEEQVTVLKGTADEQRSRIASLELERTAAEERAVALQVRQRELEASLAAIEAEKSGLQQQVEVVRAQQTETVSELENRLSDAVQEAESREHALEQALSSVSAAKASELEETRSDLELSQISVQQLVLELATSNRTANVNKDLHISASRELQISHIKLDSLTSELQTARTAGGKEQDDLRSALSAANIARDEAVSEVEALSQQLQAAVRAGEATTRKLQVETEQLSAMSVTVEEQKQEIASLNKTVEDAAEAGTASSAAEQDLRQQINHTEEARSAAEAKVEALKSELAEIESSLSQRSEEFESAMQTAQRDAEQRIGELKATILERESRIVESEAQSAAIRKQLEQSQAGQTHLKAELSACHQDLSEVSAARKQTQADLDRCLSDLANSRSIVAQAETTILELESQVQIASEETASQSHELVSLRQERDNLLANGSMVASEKEALTKELETLQTEMLSLQARFDQSVATQSEMTLNLKQRSDDLQKLQAKYHKAHEAATIVTGDITKLETKLQEKTKQLSALEQSDEAVKAERDAAQKELAGIKEDLQRNVLQVEQLNNDLEEQMADLRAANKAKLVYQRKVEKLERKIKSLSEAAPPAPVAAIPTPVEPPVVQVNSSTPQATYPLAAASHDNGRNSPLPTTTLAGQKRTREPDSAKKMAIAPDAIIQPHPFPESSTPSRKSALAGAGTGTPRKRELHPVTAFTPKSRFTEGGLPVPSPLPGSVGRQIVGLRGMGVVRERGLTDSMGMGEGDENGMVFRGR